MNNKRSITFLMLLIAPCFFGCGGSKKEHDKTGAQASPLSLHAGDENYVAIDTSESLVKWKGAMLIGSNSHTGFVYIKRGELMVENGQLIGGTVEVDMSTIEDERHGRNNNLVNHLKNADFFDVEKFPFTTVSIIKVASINELEKEITANLTIKGITHPVAFPAKVTISNTFIEASGKLTIDRTKWGVHYKSGKFYALLADQTMSDDIEFDVKLLAKK
ncbi:YceI family protein [Ferruginibacter sp. HRS2-29]|uniref:YceI family protein n=1 Tax=Ferruginibacter sp. HRS2-29 TaxID=2487334 RepID=UPI0020CBA126|nr:YceI family protein [Ferruginibacter sp. HRS2-29]MCP9753499.1 YceI family protein [Ferruginibacter sp. HRS2-29]